jgi:hypothetical protein
MRLRETFRKAAGLLVELPPETVDGGDEVDIDALLAEASRSAPVPASSDRHARVTEAAVPGTPAARTVEQIVRDTHGPNLDQITVPREAPPAVTADGKIDFPAIYAQAGLSAAAFSAEQMIDMLRSLPAELPLETRRQTVKVTLASLGKTLGASPETIVADASRKLAALSAYVDAQTHQTQEAIARAESDVAALQAQIESQRLEIEQAGQRLAMATRQCTDASHPLDELLEFFSLDVPPSRYAPGTSATASDRGSDSAPDGAAGAGRQPGAAG